MSLHSGTYSSSILTRFILHLILIFVCLWQRTHKCDMQQRQQWEQGLQWPCYLQFYIYNMAIVMIYVAETFRAFFLQMFAFYERALSERVGEGGEKKNVSGLARRNSISICTPSKDKQKSLNFGHKHIGGFRFYMFLAVPQSGNRDDMWRAGDWCRLQSSV